MRVVLTYVIFFLFLSVTVYAQERNCAAMEVLEQQIKENPQMLRNMEEIERQVQEFIRKNPNGSANRSIITIPTVVHVLYKTTAENISDAQIQSQMDVLNNDFQALNADKSLTPSIFAGVVGNIEIEFCLAVQDPSGNATTGITRKVTSKNSWGTNNDVKKSSRGGTDPWNPSNYLNIWVCNIGGGILGYAQFPGGSAATDGVVLDYRYTGTIGTATAPYHKGRTATHEVGHWLNLRHIWGDATCGSDFVNDTPVHNTSNGGCPAYPHYSTCSGAPVEMTMNYMDYTYDACMYMFSNGQKSRMRAVLEGGVRSSLLSSPGCLPPSQQLCNAPSGLNVSNVTASAASLSWSPVSNATNYSFEHKLISASTWTEQTVSGTTVNLSGLSASTSYNARVRTNCSFGTSAYSTILTFTTEDNTTPPPPSCTDNYEANNTKGAAKDIPLGTTFTAKIGTSTDRDWYKFKNTRNAKNISVAMTTLPANYDVKLYKGSTLVGSSQNTGTADELIIFNTTTKETTYYIEVYGIGGAFNADLCYNMLVQISGSSFRTFGPDSEFELEPVAGEFLVFPNPAADVLTVVLPFENEKGGVLTMLDISGKTVINEKFAGSGENNKFTLDVSEFNAGIYMLHFRTENTSYTQKLAITRR